MINQLISFRLLYIGLR